MTSINAIRFDEYSGAMVCDEQRHWNPERQKMYAADKIRPVVPREIMENYGVAAAYGNTGTSSIGDELRLTIYRKIEDIYQTQCRELNRAPDSFMSVGEIAQIMFDIICDMKHCHVDDYLYQRFGFRTADFVESHYENNGTKHSIANDKIIKEVMDNIDWNPKKSGPTAVFGNGGIIAGCDPVNGFQIYQFSMKDGFVEPVECGYVAMGSGGDTTNFVMPELFNRRGVSGRLNGIDPVEGLYSVIDAVDMASLRNLGVGGYFNIILFKQDGDRASYTEINDHRAKLAVEAVRGCRNGFIEQDKSFTILQKMLLEGKDACWGEEALWKGCSEPLKLHRMLRGYPVS